MSIQLNIAGVFQHCRCWPSPLPSVVSRISARQCYPSSSVESFRSKFEEKSEGPACGGISKIQTLPKSLRSERPRIFDFQHAKPSCMHSSERASESLPLSLAGRRAADESSCGNDIEKSVQSCAAKNCEDDRVGWLDEKWKGFSAKGMLLGVGGFLAGSNLEGPGSVAEAVLVLAVIVTIHECGHFLAARSQQIRVSKFAIGFGPTLVKWQGQQVEYTLRAIPLGGFVAFPDDDPDSEIPPDDPDLLKNRPILDRALVVSAGVLANLLLAYSVLFTQVNTVGLLHQNYQPGVAVTDVFQNSAADRAGLLPGDVVLAVNGLPLGKEEAAVADLVNFIKGNKGQQVQLGLLRKNEQLSLSVQTDRSSDGLGRIGVQLSPNSRPYRLKAADLGEAAIMAGEEFGRLLAIVVDGLKQIVFNFAQTANRISGPVAIVAVGAEVARNDVAGLFQFAAIVNLNLAVVNILPLPALDGGYLFLLLLEALRGGRKLPQSVVQVIMSSGILLLLGVGMLLIVRDAINLGFLHEQL